MIALLIAAGAAVGAPLRYLIDRGIQARFGTLFPWGTLVANVCACLVLGLITGTATAVCPPEVYALIGTGLCGALSTLSTFSYQALRFAEEGFCLFALAYVAGTVVAGLGGAGAGVAIAHATWALASRGCCRCRRSLCQRPRPSRAGSHHPSARHARFLSLRNLAPLLPGRTCPVVDRHYQRDRREFGDYAECDEPTSGNFD